MSDHTLPQDPNSWPSDPYRLLGVSPGVSNRDLRKAYLSLIRSYKPEHAPIEFQKIRQAYEMVLEQTKHWGESRHRLIDEEPIDFRSDDQPSSGAEPGFEREPERRSSPSVNPWDLACRGEPETAYGLIQESLERGNPSEEPFLQLYWLATLVPGLDPVRQPIDWLSRGSNLCGPRAGRLRELLRREIASDFRLALDDRLKRYFQQTTFPAIVLDVAGPRWKAARSNNRWSLILADIGSLRTWLPEIDIETWARLLLVASTNLAWADPPDSHHVMAFCREVERVGHRHDDFASELYQIEYIQIIKAGLDRLGGRNGVGSGLVTLLSCSWDDAGPEFRGRLRAYVDQLAREPRVALEGMDRIHNLAPAVLGRLSSLLGGLEVEEPGFHSSRLQASLAPTIERFLAEHRWNDYHSLRLTLLRFCLKECIAPGLMARTLAETPGFVLSGKNPLAQAIADDWPLRHVYRASELSREAPLTRAFGG